ncbi:MAG: 16S rRNA (guanine(527)-N(7))-methyltransferase RsmG [Chitinophagaceae bacterium]
METITKYFADFTPAQLAQFELLEPLYKEWNEKINVISRKDIDSLYLKHVLHSLSIAAIFDFQPGMQVIDIGCGGGFPGIPLAIFFPEVKFHMVDSINKKLHVVRAVAEAVNLPNITVEHTRAEAITGRKFDVGISRAVAPLKELMQWSKPLINRNANFKSPDADALVPRGLICLKGGDLAQEISESNVKPLVWPISDLFEEDFFAEKFVLQVR